MEKVKKKHPPPNTHTYEELELKTSYPPGNEGLENKTHSAQMNPQRAKPEIRRFYNCNTRWSTIIVLIQRCSNEQKKTNSNNKTREENKKPQNSKLYQMVGRNGECRCGGKQIASLPFKVFAESNGSEMDKTTEHHEWPPVQPVRAWQEANAFMSISSPWYRCFLCWRKMDYRLLWAGTPFCL